MKKVAAAALIAFLSSALCADFIRDFQAANRLFNERRWAEAAEAFGQIAETAPSAHKDKCLAYVARSLAMQKKYDEALGAAGGIKNPQLRAYATMSAMSACGKNKELLLAFKDENIGAWPEEIDYLGYKMRGTAWYNTGGHAAAVCDLEQAAARAGSDPWPKWEALYYLKCAAEQAGDIERARQAADTLLADESTGRGGWPYLLCAFWKIHLLIREKQFDTAEKMLAGLNAGRTWGQDEYQLRYHEAVGDLAGARGDKAAAREAYVRAAAVQTHPGYTENVRNKLEALNQPGEAAK